jgi:trehalose/maltose hydrolase-like predicted phosphorylase
MTVVAVAAVTVAVGAASPASGADGDDGWVLGTTSVGAATEAPPYVGNGYVGTRIPAAGAGFVDAPVATETHISGVYADVTDLAHNTLQPQGAVNLPGWTTLDFFDGTATYALSTGTVTGYQQRLNLRDGTVTTTLTWTSPSGRSTDLRYEVLLDRARPRLGAVRLSVRWRADGLFLAPSLPAQLAGGLDLVGLRWQGRIVDVHVRADATRVVLRSGAPMTITSPAGSAFLRTGHQLRLATAVPAPGACH